MIWCSEIEAGHPLFARIRCIEVGKIRLLHFNVSTLLQLASTSLLQYQNARGSRLRPTERAPSERVGAGHSHTMKTSLFPFPVLQYLTYILCRTTREQRAPASVAATMWSMPYVLAFYRDDDGASRGAASF